MKGFGRWKSFLFLVEVGGRAARCWMQREGVGFITMWKVRYNGENDAYLRRKNPPRAHAHHSLPDAVHKNKQLLIFIMASTTKGIT